MKAILSTFLLLTLLTISAHSQTFSAAKPAAANWPTPTVRQAPAIRAGQPITLTYAQVLVGVRRIDSLQQLAANRKKQTLVAARLANNCFRGADSLRTVLDYKDRELASVKAAYVNLNILAVNETAKATKFKKRAHRKGWVIAALSAGLAAVLVGQAAR